jgi:hypothetical protein
MAKAFGRQLGDIMPPELWGVVFSWLGPCSLVRLRAVALTAKELADFVLTSHMLTVRPDLRLRPGPVLARWFHGKLAIPKSLLPVHIQETFGTLKQVGSWEVHKQASVRQVFDIGSGCPELTSISFSHSELNEVDLEAAVTSIALGCTGLTRIDLSGCSELTEAGLAALASNCPALNTINLFDCAIDEVAIQSLPVKWPALTEVDISYSNAEATTTATILPFAQCSSLTKLGLGGCYEVTDAAIAALIAGCPKLKTINLTSGLALTDSVFSTIPGTLPWQSVNLSLIPSSDLTGQAFISLAKRCPSLTSLTISESNITDEIVASVAAACPLLTFLDVSANLELTDKAVTSLAPCSSLASVNFHGCANLTDMAATSLAKVHAVLRSVDLSYCPKIADVGVASLATNCPSLTSINLSYCPKLTDAAVASLAANCRSLTHVDLSHCVELTDAAVASLAAGCPSLASVTLSRCTKLTDETGTSLASCRSLTYVDVSGCAKFTDNATASLASCPSLARVALDDCVQLTDATLDSFTSRTPPLECEDLRGCHGMTQPGQSSYAECLARNGLSPKAWDRLMLTRALADAYLFGIQR